ncbi:hypothetical protein K1719_046072 [Acacia pycnantha]|nr:hypothetical protein K1719_046072 [Acacia pycnantha]
MDHVALASLPKETSKEEFCLALRNDLILCNVLNKGASMSKVVDFILYLKGYYKWKLAGGIGEWRYGGTVRITSFPKGSSSSIIVGEGTNESLDEFESSQYEQLLEFLHLSSEVSIEETRTFNVLAFLFDHFGLRLLQAYLRETDGIEDLPMNSMEAVKLVQPSTRREGFSSIPNVKWEDISGLDLLRQYLPQWGPATTHASELGTEDGGPVFRWEPRWWPVT